MSNLSFSSSKLDPSILFADKRFQYTLCIFIPNDANLGMAPEAVDAEEGGGDLETPVCGLFIVDAVEHASGFDLLCSPDHTDDVDGCAMGSCDGRCFCRSGDGGGCDCVGAGLLGLGEDVGGAVVGIQDRDCLYSAPPRVRH